MEFVLNGRRVQAEQLPVQTTLLDFIRSRGLTGAKEGCAEGECGACTVVLVKDCACGSEFRAVNSCLLFLPTVAGQEVYTVENLVREGRLGEAQQALARGGGSQCGYCTPGFVMSLFAEHYRPGRKGPCDLHALDGNLCRCTGYRPIRDAALSLGTPPNDEFSARLALPAPALEPFTYASAASRFVRPKDLSAALRMLASEPSAKVLAGGTDLAVESNLRDRRWPTILSIEALPELMIFEDSETEVEIGAGLTLSEIESRWEHRPDAFRDWFPLFASPLIRNRATLGGNLATASPIGDAAPLLLAFQAQVRIAGSGGERRIPLAAFFQEYRKTDLAAGELIVSVIVPKPFPTDARFYKVAKRKMDDISTVAAAFALHRDENGRIIHARLAYGGVAATPVRVESAEKELENGYWTLEAMGNAQSLIARRLRPLGDHRGSAEYRLAMAQTLLAKFFHQTRGRRAA